jgi:exosortase E/protease (VPEID-CTERM system)
VLALRGRWLLLLRTGLLLGLFFVQVEAVEIALRHYYDGPLIRASIWAPILGYQRYVFSFGLVFLAGLLIAVRPRLSLHTGRFLDSADSHRWLPALARQLCAFVVFAGLTYALTVHGVALGGLTGVVLAVWGVALVASGLSALQALAPFRFWLRFATQEWAALSLAVALGLGAVLITMLLVRALPVLAEMTLEVSAQMLRVFFTDVVADPAARTLGVDAFRVKVTNACSGYEGIALVTVFLALYLWLFRRDFRFPQVLLAFPIGVAVIWTFNAVRIALLVAIGARLSPDVAIAGFHSNAGWIAFILVSFGLLAVLHRSAFFAVDRSAGDGRRAAVGAADALLLPLIVLLAMTLLTGALSAGFYWLYPVKVIVTGAVLTYFWRQYGFGRLQVGVAPVLIGVAVFALWLLLVPVSLEENLVFEAALAGAAPWLVFVWLVFRVLGAAITVPLAEELAFRGYLLAKLARGRLTPDATVPFTWLSFVVSSVLFGVFHGAWLAGTVAGAAYALARYRRGVLGDAVVAHMTTNLLLALYVLLTRQWAYW